MKRVVIMIGVALLVAQAAFAEPPRWWIALHGAYLSARELAQVTFPQQLPSASPAPLTPSPMPNVGPSIGPDLGVVVAPTGAFKYQPSVIISAGGGFASPNGKFAYYSISKATGIQNTYLTAAQEYTIVKGHVESCTLAGASKPIYEFGWLDIGLTGLAGGCSSTSGQAAVAGSGQVFALVHFGKSPLGIVITALKNNTGGYKVTLAPSWGK